MKPMPRLLALLTLAASLFTAAHAFAQADVEAEAAADIADDSEWIEDDDPSAVVIFRDELDPYGTWVDHPEYGTLWVPSSRIVGGDFAPYVSDGRWELTSDGDWLWVSDYDWGHIPFHYGRWVWVDGIGWSWIPGRVYAPAWVVWRVGADGYIGWAPAPPSFYWVNGYAYEWWWTPVAAYVFCPTVHVFHHHVRTHVIHDHHVVAKASKATRPYVPASVKRTRVPAQPQKGGVFRSQNGPSLEDAGIKKGAAPKATGKHSAKATQFMTKSATSKKATASKKAAAAPKAAGVAGFTTPKVSSATPSRSTLPSVKKAPSKPSAKTSKAPASTNHRPRLRKPLTLGAGDAPVYHRGSSPTDPTYVKKGSSSKPSKAPVFTKSSPKAAAPAAPSSPAAAPKASTRSKASSPRSFRSSESASSPSRRGSSASRPDASTPSAPSVKKGASKAPQHSAPVKKGGSKGGRSRR